ncbi:hypothetical protein [Aliterella atlantica]|uniref:Uncharacterized protein n=1 Tax=Aliterella atlantica CENA595 TaxID=1618023 RepID=A0A0D8ZKN2_9CYAN|nr:hypothetical protein [Aliterella atlantica]KJH69398.1 hypothetical protein UH38_24145 [Aliterella atlantica CENA595]
MPDYKTTYPMVLNGVFIGLVSLRSDQIDYFGIPDATPAELAFVKYTGSIKAHTRKVRSKRLEANSPIIEVTVDRKTGVGRERGKIAKGRGGKPFKIPTELVNTPAPQPSTTGTPRPARSTPVYTTIRFPGDASIAEISAWLHAKLLTKKPKSFQSPSGKTYSVSPLAVGSVVSGDEDTTP